RRGAAGSLSGPRPFASFAAHLPNVNFRLRIARGWVGHSAHETGRGSLGLRRSAVAVLGVLALAGCGSSGKGPVTLNWYVFPEPSGSFATAAANCSKASGGRYKININLLSTSSDQQRVSLVRRLAAHDSSIDILAMDVDWTPEFATAKWIRPWPAALAAQETRGDLAGPIATATWQGKLYGGPINTNHQLP